MKTTPIVIDGYVDVLTEQSRAGIYTLEHGRLRRIAETSMKGVGSTLECLRDEGEIGHDTLVGILDRQARRWLVNPYAHGRPA